MGYEATVFINGLQAGFHRGGYSRFAVDVTNYTIADGPNELYIKPDSLSKSRGANISEQFTGSSLSMTPQTAAAMSSRSASGHCAHRTSSTGPQWHLAKCLDQVSTIQLCHSARCRCKYGWSRLVFSNYCASAVLTLRVISQCHSAQLFWKCSSGRGHCTGMRIKQGGGSTIPIYSAFTQPMVPDSPTLYNLAAKMGTDEISSYTRFRTISKGMVDGITRPLLNGKFIFQFGTLDQGYWPDGLYTALNREAMVYDLEVLKKLASTWFEST